MDAIEHWPREFIGNPPLETIVNGDGTRRLHFVRRADGAVVFFIQELRRMETEGQEFLVWYPGQKSGLYPDLTTAKQDAERIISWLRIPD
ncbi:MAG: hypothetical protein JO256_04695 [Alphaproteobacteria bacterium]|nr:hypothetical protein [Alphaproteobacteria bacterium]